MVVYPGTFDPITLGHVDVVQRAIKLFGKLIVAVASNPQKKPLFSLEERISLVKRSLAGFQTIEVDSFDGLLVEYALQRNCSLILRGLRELSDFEREFQHAIVNRKLAGSIETVFIMTSAKYFYLNSTVVKEIASLGGKLDCFVPKPVEDALRKKFRGPKRPTKASLG
jgi:pantetheine-phosphate adenylyltransferase